MTLSCILAISGLATAIGALVMVIFVSRALRNGLSIHLLTFALVYAVIVRSIIVADNLGWLNIDTGIMGPPFYALLIAGFYVLYRGIQRIGK
jgi:hypothetical protein